MTSSVPSPLDLVKSSRSLGFHYFSDTLHYRRDDLETWLPKLKSLGARWLVLRSETGRAIPEAFLAGLAAGGIEPVVHFAHPEQAFQNGSLDTAEIKPLLEAYARWGVKRAIFFDRPNQRVSVAAHNWIQQDPIKAFIDRFLPAASLAVKAGLQPVFPPLTPGGGYWDTAFLRAALSELKKRQDEAVLSCLALSAYGWTFGHPLDWGAGGPERWPWARPYNTSPETQDQRGFRIFDWYQAIARDLLEQPAPIFLLQAGSPADPESAPLKDPASYAADCLSIYRLLTGGAEDEPAEGVEGSLPPIPAQVQAVCFWLLAAEPGEKSAAHAWFTPHLDQPGKWVESAAAAKLREWLTGQPAAAVQGKGIEASRPIKHYLLLPGYEWGVPDWYLEVAKPFIKKYRPTVGFAFEEAQLASKVTVVGKVSGVTAESLNRLREKGCSVEWIDGDGTTIATQLAER